MRPKYQKLLLAAAMAGLAPLAALAQFTFVKGYVVTDKGDTLRGEVKVNPKKEHEGYQRVTFKDASGAQKNYKPAKTKGYGFENNHFISWGKEEEALFYKRLANGPIFFYKSAFEVVSMNKSTWEFDYFLFKEGEKKMTDAKIGKFQKQLKEWMKDAQEYAEYYKENSKDIDEASAIEAITKYNDSKKQ
jgi:hypothetical protein